MKDTTWITGCASCPHAVRRFNLGHGATTCTRMDNQTVAVGLKMPATRPDGCPLPTRLIDEESVATLARVLGVGGVIDGLRCGRGSDGKTVFFAKIGGEERSGATMGEAIDAAHRAAFAVCPECDGRGEVWDYGCNAPEVCRVCNGDRSVAGVYPFDAEGMVKEEPEEA